MKKQTTRWIWVSLAAENTGIRVGYIHNKSSGNREDVIRVEIRSKTCNVEFRCRLDEAVALAAGLNKVSAQMLWGMLKIPRPKKTLCAIEQAKGENETKRQNTRILQ